MLPLRCHPHLYEFNTWVWLERLSKQLKRRLTLGHVPDAEWDALQRRGFDLIWLMGVWERSPESRRLFQADPAMYPEYEQALPGWDLGRVVGSPYAVRAYRPDPRIGTWSEIDRTREKLHARGMRLILDFVPNHTALDHPWVTEHPEYYVTGLPPDAERNPGGFFAVEPDYGSPVLIARARDPYFPPWKDLAQLNLFQPETRTALRFQLREIARHCDGVRCDMAMLILNDIFAKTWRGFVSEEPPAEEFWTEAISSLSGFLWLAEVYWGLESRLQQLGFDFTYDKTFYDLLRTGQPRELREQLSADFAYQSRVARFLENHDEPRSAAVFGRERQQALATLLATSPGLRFYHQGQLEGARIHWPIPLCEAAEEPWDPAITALYEKTLRLSNEEVFHTGEWKLLDVRPAGDESSENLIAYRWRSGQAHKIIVLNPAGKTSQGRIPLAGEVSATRGYNLCDELNEATYQRSGEEMARHGLYVRLDGYRAHWLDVSPA